MTTSTRPHRGPTALLPLGVGLALALALSAPAQAAKPGFGGWRFGMTLAEVQAVKACRPYKPVRSTGGLECPNFRYMGMRLNVSFVFRGGRLAKIQVWAYEGHNADALATRAHALFRHLRRTYGPLESPQLGDPAALSRAAIRAQARALAASRRLAKIQFKPKRNPREHFTFGSLASHPRHGFYLFLYFQPPR